MKKIKLLIFALALVTVFSLLSVFVDAKDVSPKFTSAFFPEGSIGKPTDIYCQEKKDDDGRVNLVYLWLTQPDDIVNMFRERSNIGEDTFAEKYKCRLDVYYLQIDCKVDGGDWHYVPEWDVDEYPQEGQPYDMVLYQRLWASETQSTYRSTGAFIDPWYGRDDDSNAGFLKPLIKEDGENAYLDLDNHTLSFRLRYLIKYNNDTMTEEELEANEWQDSSYLYSDWSDEISIGKNGTQVELAAPEKIEAPTISQLTYIEGERDDDNVTSLWKVFVDFPKSNGDAAKYYEIIEDAFEPLQAILEYRVLKNGEWGEWTETYWGNSDWLFSMWKDFEVQGADENDSIEFRVHILNNVDREKNSDYSNVLSCYAGTVFDTEPVTCGTEQKGTDLEPTDLDVKPENKKCKVCGICLVQPLGICLFIWLAIILAVIILVIIIALSGKKKCPECGEKCKKNEKVCPKCGHNF